MKITILAIHLSDLTPQGTGKNINGLKTRPSADAIIERWISTLLTFFNDIDGIDNKKNILLLLPRTPMYAPIKEYSCLTANLIGS